MLYNYVNCWKKLLYNYVNCRKKSVFIGLKYLFLCAKYPSTDLLSSGLRLCLCRVNKIRETVPTTLTLIRVNSL